MKRETPLEKKEGKDDKKEKVEVSVPNSME